MLKENEKISIVMLIESFSLLTNLVRIDNALSLFTAGEITGILVQRDWCTINYFQKDYYAAY